ncbi:MAG: LysM peptidoglycan-binding domain-containing protein [Chloroflexi bacterium]|nr:LysM peptidoglycan-binding domain-containing protein [Chloroflexota bacterium]
MLWKRLAIFLVLNAIVSATVTLTVLWVWDRTHRDRTPQGPPAALTPGGPAADGQQGTAVAGGGGTSSSGTQTGGGGNATTGLATITPTVYVVQPGDTLGKIAAEYDVSVENLMAANGLTNPDVLDVGQTLIIPVGEFSVPVASRTPSPTVTAIPTESAVASPTSPPAAPTSAGTAPTSPPISTQPSSAGAPQLAIRGIIGAGDVAEERVTIVNVGGDVSLAGWTLHDSQGNVFRFPALSLFQGGAVTVHTKTGTNTVTDLYWNQTAAIWQTGEKANLVDPTGAVHTTFVVP